MGIGDWGLGIWGFGPNTKNQKPKTKTQTPKPKIIFFLFYVIKKI